MSETEERGADGTLDHAQRALNNALAALRCYVTLVSVEGARRGKQLVWGLALVGLGLIGLALFAGGLSRFLDGALATAGAGGMIVGGSLLGLLLVLVVATWARRS